MLTRHINERIGRDGPLFRGRFHSVVIDSDEQLLCSVRYVHRNALDIAGVGAPDEYRWSSHRAYLGCRRAPDFLFTGELLDHFGGDASAFAAFVLEEASSPGEVRSVPSLEQLSSIINLVLDEVLQSDVVKAHVCRTVMVLMLDLLPLCSRNELADRLAFATAKSRCQAQRRATERASAEPVLAFVARRTIELLA